MHRDRPSEAPDVRAFLERLAAEARTPAEEARPVIRRARRRVAATIAGGTLAIALLASAGVSALDAVRTSDRRTPLQSVSPTPPPPSSPSVAITGRFHEKDLRDLVLRASDRPLGYGLRHSSAYAEYEDVTEVAPTLGVPVEALIGTGFVTAFINGFLTDSFNDPLALPRDRLDLISYALLFPDGASAKEGLTLLGAGPTQGVTGWRSAAEAELGPGAKSGRGTFAGLATVAFVWRVDNVVLFIASQGGRDALPDDLVRSLAGELNAQAA